jgi:hypothetical protein
MREFVSKRFSIGKDTPRRRFFVLARLVGSGFAARDA